MHAGRLRGDEEFLGDPAVGTARRDQPQYVPFAAGQPQGLDRVHLRRRRRPVRVGGVEWDPGAPRQQGQVLAQPAGAEALGGGMGLAEQFGGRLPVAAGHEQGLAESVHGPGEEVRAGQGSDHGHDCGPVRGGVPALGAEQLGPDVLGVRGPHRHRGRQGAGGVAQRLQGGFPAGVGGRESPGVGLRGGPGQQERPGVAVLSEGESVGDGLGDVVAGLDDPALARGHADLQPVERQPVLGLGVVRAEVRVSRGELRGGLGEFAAGQGQVGEAGGGGGARGGALADAEGLPRLLRGLVPAAEAVEALRHIAPDPGLGVQQP